MAAIKDHWPPLHPVDKVEKVDDGIHEVTGTADRAHVDDVIAVYVKDAVVTGLSFILKVSDVCW